MDNDVLITGIGLVSSLGEGLEPHWRAFSGGRPPVLDGERFAPYTIHPLPEIDWNAQIPRRGDQRQMETWQRLGTYAAGMALDDAGLKDDEALKATADLVVAAGGGERDVEVDEALLADSAARTDHGLLVNEKLSSELRPTLFLAQLSNLLAGNISIVHKVTGSSRTFMGEEGAGVAAIETAAARIRAGQSSHILVGGAFQTEHPDMLLGYELGGFLHRGKWQPVWQRGAKDGGGVVTGSGAAFLMLESRDHARKRNARAYAEIELVQSGRASREDGTFEEAISGLLRGVLEAERPSLVVSGASGAHAATAAERQALSRFGEQAVRAMSSLTGHLKEAQFPFAVALAALALHNARPIAALDPQNEASSAVPTDEAVVTTIGYHRFEGVGRLRAVGKDARP